MKWKLFLHFLDAMFLFSVKISIMPLCVPTVLFQWHATFALLSISFHVSNSPLTRIRTFCKTSLFIKIGKSYRKKLAILAFCQPGGVFSTRHMHKSPPPHTKSFFASILLCKLIAKAEHGDPKAVPITIRSHSSVVLWRHWHHTASSVGKVPAAAGVRDRIAYCKIMCIRRRMSKGLVQKMHWWEKFFTLHSCARFSCVRKSVMYNIKPVSLMFQHKATHPTLCRGQFVDDDVTKWQRWFCCMDDGGRPAGILCARFVTSDIICVSTGCSFCDVMVYCCVWTISGNSARTGWPGPVGR